MPRKRTSKKPIYPQNVKCCDPGAHRSLVGCPEGLGGSKVGWLSGFEEEVSMCAVKKQA